MARDAGRVTMTGRSSIDQLDKNYFIRSDGIDTPGFRQWRGALETSGKFGLSPSWTWGWDGVLVSDQTFFQDYKFLPLQQTSLDPQLNALTEGVSQLYLTGRGDRSYFDARAMYFYGFAGADVQAQIPIVAPVIDHDYTVDEPIYGGELSFHNNLTSITRQSANFDPISTNAINTGLCTLNTADPASVNPSNCVLRGVPGTYTRFSTEVDWRRTFIDPYGEMFTPFFSLRGDVASVQVYNQPGVANYINPGTTDIARVMPT